MYCEILIESSGQVTEVHRVTSFFRHIFGIELVFEDLNSAFFNQERIDHHMSHDTLEAVFSEVQAREAMRRPVDGSLDRKRLTCNGYNDSAVKSCGGAREVEAAVERLGIQGCLLLLWITRPHLHLAKTPRRKPETKKPTQLRRWPQLLTNCKREPFRKSRWAGRNPTTPCRTRCSALPQCPWCGSSGRMPLIPSLDCPDPTLTPSGQMGI